MASTARKISIAGLLFLLLLAGGLYYAASNLNGIVADIIETQGSAATQTSVRVNGVDIRLTEAAAAISGLRVENPEGFPGSAIELGRFSVRLDAASLSSDTLVVNAITVDGARINVLQTSSGNNLQKLLANLQTRSGEPPARDGASKKVIIEKFTLDGAIASISVPELNEKREVSLPAIVVQDIGRASNGATAAQVARQILRPIVDKAVASAAAQTLKERASEEIGNALGGMLEGLSGNRDEAD